MNVEIGRLFWEYINRNQTFILDSHQPFIRSVATQVGRVEMKVEILALLQKALGSIGYLKGFGMPPP